VLVLVRHGQSSANADGLLVGRSDPALTPLGERQAAATAAAVVSAAEEGGRDVLRVVTSPLRRTIDTARAICAAWQGVAGEPPDLAADERAIELDYGSLEGRAVAEVPPAIWRAWREDPGWRPPGGETLVEVARRTRLLLEDLAEEAAARDIVVVSHVSPIKAGACWALGIGIEASWRMSLGVSSITRLAVGGGRVSLAGFGDVSHLHGL
jgi:broad specificity phosphatase PhoE